MSDDDRAARGIVWIQAILNKRRFRSLPVNQPKFKVTESMLLYC